jgi:RNA polymerase sigma-70 factor (ECF subfamily)
MQIEYDDNIVIERVLDGDVDCFERLIEKYKSKVFSIVSKRIPFSEVEEVAHEIFIRAYKGLASFSGKSPFENWISSVAMRACCDFWRKNEKDKKVDRQGESLDKSHLEWIDSIGLTASADEFERLSARAEAKELVDYVLRKLDVEDRALVEMVYFEGWQLKDAASAMEWGLSKTKVKAMRARKKMRKLLENILKEGSDG